MKKKFLIIGIAIIICFLILMSLQVFVQPKIVEGDHITLQQSYTHHTNEVWEVKFSPNDS